MGCYGGWVCQSGCGVCVLRQMWVGCVMVNVGWVYKGGCGVGMLWQMWEWCITVDGSVKVETGLFIDWTLGHLSFDGYTGST